MHLFKTTIKYRQFPTHSQQKTKQFVNAIKQSIQLCPRIFRWDSVGVCDHTKRVL